MPVSKRFAVIAILMGCACSLETAFAADSLEVIIPESARVGEAVDITVRALETDGSVDVDYEGNIYISVLEDPNATVPFVEDGYTFAPADQGEKVFSKGLSFTQEGTMTVSVIDLIAEELEGVASIEVLPAGGEQMPGEIETAELSISNPTNGAVINTDSVDVIGTTKRNSRVQISLNGEVVGTTQSDENGAFLYTLEDLPEANNVMRVRVLDGDDVVIGESEDMLFSVEDAGPVIQGVSIVGGDEVSAGRPFDVEVLSEPGLPRGSVTFMDTPTPLSEQEGGLYTVRLVAPEELGEYPIDVSLENDLGIATTQIGVVIATVVEPTAAFESVRVETEDGRATFTFSLVEDVENLVRFKFQYGTGTGELSEEVITLDREQIVTSDETPLEYAWYVDGLEPDEYRFQIYGLDAENAEISGVVSDEILVSIAANAAPECSVQNITGLSADREGDMVVLTWDAASDATDGYNVYRRDGSGSYHLIENVSDNRYTTHFSRDRIEYTDFAVKGVCGD